MGVGDGVRLGVGLGRMALGVAGAGGVRVAGSGVAVTVASGASPAPGAGDAHPVSNADRKINSKNIRFIIRVAEIVIAAAAYKCTLCSKRPRVR